MAPGELRLFDNVGEGSREAEFRSGRGPSLPAARLLQLDHRLQALGSPAQSSLQVPQAVVRTEELRHIRTTELHPAPLPPSKAFRGARQKGQPLPRLQRSQGLQSISENAPHFRGKQNKF